MSKFNKTDRKEQYKDNRKALIALSNNLRQLVKEGVYSSVNEALLDHYAGDNPEVHEFNTFWQWKEQGYTIVKGCKAYHIWGQPRKAAQTDDTSEDETYKFWPLCYLFDNTQVYKKEPVQVDEIEQVEEPAPEPEHSKELIL